jgi:hypothetical protein
VPLTAFQAELARLLSSNRTSDSYLAGGAAILLEPSTSRFSRDLDYFHDSPVRVAQAFAADSETLASSGYSVEVELQQPGYIRGTVRKGDAASKVEWAHDSSFRFLPTVRDAEVGFVLHPIDLAVNKLLALAGRDEPRDVLDTVDYHQHLLGLGPLCWAACGKDPGFNPLSLLELLRRRGRLRQEDLERLALARPVDLEQLKRVWLEALDSVEPFVVSRPPDEIGCLYYSAAKSAFVDPRETADAVPHFGRPGGVLPRVGD